MSPAGVDFLLAGIALALVLLGWVAWSTAGRFSGAEAEATVLSFERHLHRHGDGGSNMSYHVEAEWLTPDGQRHTDQIHTYSEPGETITVYYDPERPGDATSTSPAENRVWGVLLWLAAGGFAIAAAIRATLRKREGPTPWTWLLAALKPVPRL